MRHGPLSNRFNPHRSLEIGATRSNKNDSFDYNGIMPRMRLSAPVDLAVVDRLPRIPAICANDMDNNPCRRIDHLGIGAAASQNSRRD